MAWTDEQVEILEKLWREGFSASQIAAELGDKTRNAVIGKVHRVGMSNKDSRVSLTDKNKRRPKAKSPKTTKKNTIPTKSAGTKRESNTRGVDLPKPRPKMISLMQLSETTCKFPIGESHSPDFGFCGHSVKSGGKYCEYHTGLCIQPSPERKRSINKPVKRQVVDTNRQ